ncbi:hypothetical protein IM40_00875 [Candidatus Paracaedimonas acanthamoebae]|nr:hypothetical protein IM40_00875 [Candidatus Paracaedimonas acanthamoebae]
MIKSVIFDVDGVVFESQDASGNYIWSRSIRKELGVRGFYFKEIFSSEWDNVTKGKIGTLEYLRKVF